MTKAGVYIHIKSGRIWIADKVEHYEASVTGTEEMSIVVSGYADRQKIRRCLIRKNQYSHFKRIGSFK